jgi:hypothetical protein
MRPVIATITSDAAVSPQTVMVIIGANAEVGGLP